ncbi:alpha-amylase domain-containing protein [Haloarcula argentinensis]|uniref:alpha-amylase domain-containing protein n=1 Tax=Haloarcula argentinensis TaxID=43776 RepID=UPI00067829D8|nr:alpha-amylase domain-containing protein [Haloarcula argentinensis]
MNRTQITGSGRASRRTVLKGIGALGAAVFGTATSVGSSAAVGDSAVYQYYHTDWTEVTATLETVAQQGYDAIQVPPAHRSRLDRNHQNGVTDPPLGYQPVDLTDFNSVFGTEPEYEAMVQEAHNQGLDVVVDAVINHMAANDDFRDAPGITFEDLPRFSERDFHPKDDINYDDPESVEDDWLVGLKDLKQTSEYVRGELQNYVQKYADLGVDGIRWDAAKHVPESFFADYANQWADDLDLWTVGEVLDGDVSVCQGYADTGMSVTDYPLYYTMKEETFHSGGDMQALDGAGMVNQSPFQAFTFVSNHDSGPPDYEKLAYAYILTYEGYPRVYSNRISVDDDDIRNLLWIRNNLASGDAQTRHVDQDLYVYERKGNLLVGLNRASGQRSKWVPTSWTNQALNDYSGNAGNVSTNGDSWVQITVPATSWVCYAPE